LLAIVGGLAWAGIEGSKHDFSNEAWSEGETCAACHSPHRAEAPKAAPLWDPNADLTRTFGAAAGDKATPGLGTLMCLRCHDGTIASETITGVKTERFSKQQNPGRFTTGHGTSDHPVGVEYPQFDKGYRPLVSVVASGTVTLPESKVECVSCHDPHNEADQEHMLVTSNARSALCLTCHKK
jgi:predicted CXXCH cytochrome family protein